MFSSLINTGSLVTHELPAVEYQVEITALEHRLVSLAQQKNADGNKLQSAFGISVSEKLRPLVSRMDVSKDVQDEVMATVVWLFGWVKVVPVLIVHRDSHFGCIAIIHVIVRLWALEVLRIIDVWIMIESLPVGGLPRRSGLNCFSVLHAGSCCNNGKQEYSLQHW